MTATLIIVVRLEWLPPSWLLLRCDAAGRGLKIPRLAEAHMPGTGYDQMIMDRDIQAVCGIDNFPSEGPVGPRRLRLT